LKKSIFAGLLATSVFALGACGGQETAKQTEEPKEVEEVKDPTQESDNVDEQIAEAKEWALARVDGIIANAEKLEEAIHAGDFEKAKQQWLPTQLEYEKGEALFATLSPELDETMDVSAETGFHGLEQILWGKEDPSIHKEKLLEITTLLKEDATKLKEVVEAAELNEQLLFEAMTGILPELAGFVEAVYTGESVSGTRIEDARNVFDGVQLFYNAISPKVVSASAEVDQNVHAQIEKVLEVMGQEKPDVQTVDEEFGALFNLMVEAATTIGVQL
jgi:iron uptake system EfeUOB component EfeO/EfeM